MIDAALVLEGGALRSVFTAGVLDVFMNNDLYFKSVFGVSAGALTAANYISKQPGRTAHINLEHTKDANYYGLMCWLKKRSIFNFDYIFGKPINKLIPFDEETFKNSKQQFISVATNCKTGESKYMEEKTYQSLILALKASSSMPLLSQSVVIEDDVFLDGGISDPVPIKKAQEKYSKIVVVLTRECGFRKNKQLYAYSKLLSFAYRNYPLLVDKLLHMPDTYNSCMDYLDQLEKENMIFIIRPKKSVNVSRTEKNRQKLLNLYREGVNEAENLIDCLMNYLDGPV